VRVLIALIIWAGAIVGGAWVSSSVAHSIHHNKTTASSGGFGSSPGSGNSGGYSSGGGGGSSVDPSSIKAADKLSLFRAANLARVLKVVRSHVGPNAKVTLAALYPGYLSLSMVHPEAEVYASTTGTFERDVTNGSPGSQPSFALSKIQAGTPAAIAKRIATKAHFPESQLHYMVAMNDPISGQFRWLVYPVAGSKVEYFEAPPGGGQLLELRNNSSTGPQPVR
jgi:hypothetical protein